MAEFAVKIHRIRLEPHPNADAIELAAIGGYRSVVKLGQFQEGDLLAYIPEGAIIPSGLLQEMGLENYLAGPEQNRVKAIRLRGIVSQGLVWPVPDAQEGEDVTERLGITKYVPEVPSDMNGEAYPARGMVVKFDVEDIKQYPDVLQEGEEIVATEKLHGTFCQMGFHHDIPIVSQKGIGNQGLALMTGEVNDRCIYVQEFRKHLEALKTLHQLHPVFYLLGEIHGAGVQDLKYDLKEKRFRVFDVYLGEPDGGRFLNQDEMLSFIDGHFEPVPLVYRGPYRAQEVAEISQGQSLIASHMREGVVIKPTTEREDMFLGRVILKSKADRYLLRKDNPTEFE